MALRIPWNEHEQAILLQTLIDVLEGKIERKQAISEVSRKLRTMAAAQGIAIDEKFRNENGISLQMDCLRYAYTEGKHGLHVTRGWYFDIVQKYKNNREEYETLLLGVNEMLTTSVDNKTGLKIWLKRSHAERDVAAIIASLAVIEVLLRKNHVINGGLFEIESPDEISEIIEKIKNNSGIRLHSKSHKAKAINALNIYREFIRKKKENLESKPQQADGEDAPVKEDSGLAKPNVDFYVWLTETEGLAEKSGRSYSSAINSCNSFCQSHGIGTGRIYGAESLGEVEKNIALLQENAEFQKTNDIQHHRLTAALAKYLKFLGLQGESSGTHLIRRAASREHGLNQDEIERITATLALPRFEYGFKDDGVELYRFRASYEEVNGTDCPLDDDILLDAIRKMGFEFGGKVYLISDDSMKSIADEINDYQKQGVNIVYYDSLYELKSYVYFEAKIVSADMLKAILTQLMPQFRYKNNYFALPQERQTELELIRNDVIRVWGSDMLQTFDDLSRKLPLIPLDKIKFALAQQDAFVWNSVETYMQADRFEADYGEIAKLADYIDEQCEEDGGVSLDELPLDNLIGSNPEISETALYTCFCRLVKDRFERNARVLTRKGANKDTYTAVVEFCRKQDKCTYERLEAIAKRVAGTIRRPDIIEAANAVMVRVDQNDFIADRFINFDIERIDAALDYIVTDAFIGMREITTFSTLPFCGYGWNLFLLESYCRRFSRKYKFETRRANSSNSGAIVAKTCKLNYHEIMTRAVARSGRELHQEEVFDYLTETGYMERKKYSDIDSLIKEAAHLRERRK